MIKSPISSRYLFGLVFVFAITLSACYFDKEIEVINLKLDGIPADVDVVVVSAMDSKDTSIEFEVLYNGPWAAGETKPLDLNAAKGKDWKVKATGFHSSGDLLYFVLIPSGKNGISDSAVHVDVKYTWPAVIYTSVKGDLDLVQFKVVYRNAPSGTHWHLNLGAISSDVNKYVVSHDPSLTVPLSKVNTESLLIADLRSSDHMALPVQSSDTMLVAEILRPVNSIVIVDRAYRISDSVYLELLYQNFRSPLVDEPTPGQGLAKVFDARTMRLLASFSHPFGTHNRLVGVASELLGVDSILIALHYANQMRIRPMVSYTIASATALIALTANPSLKVLRQDTVGTLLRLTFEKMNFTGLHVHVYRESIATNVYQICEDTVCDLLTTIWSGASKLIVTTNLEINHAFRKPMVTDTVWLP